MALRLSQPAPGPAQTPSTATLPARASALLAARDLNGYRALFAQAAAETDVHLRYGTRVRLLEAGLSVPRGSVTDTANAFLVVAGAAVEILESEPREPVLLNLAGVALYELGALAGARFLFEAALRLDPELPNTERNLREIARRRQGRAPAVKLPPAVLAALRPLEARAKRVANRAKPAEGLTLSLCMIVRDEEAMLGRCLESVKGAVDEIIVVDTGSTDSTIEIARSYGATVIEREWTGSFADARNVSFDAATSDWIMYLDADEALFEGEAERLRALTGRTWREAFYVVETNHTGELDDGTAVNHDALRMFRNRPEYRFDGRIHEQIASTLPGDLPERLERTDVRVEHFGYLGVVREAKDKSTRNLELLERQVAEGVDTPFLQFNLGSERSALGQHAAALEHFRRAWEGVQAEPTLLSYGYVPSLTSRFAQALRVAGERKELARHVEAGLQIFPDFTDLVFEHAIAAKNAGDLAAARALLARCLEMGDAPSRYSPMVGSGTYMPLCVLGDIHRAAGEFEEAERLLRRSLAEHPRFLGAIEPLAQAMLGRGADPDEVVVTIDGSAAEDTPARHFLLAVPLYEAGAVEAAERELRAVLDRQPHAGPARAALAEALLSQKRYADAAEVAAVVAPEAPVASSAARAELFARLAGGEDGPLLDAALARARAAGLPADEIALFEAWRALAAGGHAPPALGSGATGPLLAVLEALLRVQDVEPFVAVLPLAERLPLPRRRRREALAMMYLRRGFLESAADEWAAACHEDGPDADALAGLAAIAVARADLDDAELFALGAQELEPGHAGAMRVLERIAA